MYTITFTCSWSAAIRLRSIFVDGKNKWLIGTFIYIYDVHVYIYSYVQSFALTNDTRTFHTWNTKFTSTEIYNYCKPPHPYLMDASTLYTHVQRQADNVRFLRHLCPHTHSYSYTHMHTHIHTHAHTHVRTHTHMSVCLCVSKFVLSCMFYMPMRSHFTDHTPTCQFWGGKRAWAAWYDDRVLIHVSEILPPIAFAPPSVHPFPHSPCRTPTQRARLWSACASGAVCLFPITFHYILMHITTSASTYIFWYFVGQRATKRFCMSHINTLRIQVFFIVGLCKCFLSCYVYNKHKNKQT